MLDKSHLIVSVGLGAALGGAAMMIEPSVYLGAGAFVGAVLGGLYPNADEKFSYINHNRYDEYTDQEYPKVNLMACGHRRFTHTIPGIIFASLPFWALWLCLSGVFDSRCFLTGAVGVILGGLLHLIMDTFTSSGIMWAWPFSKQHLGKSNPPSNKELAGAIIFGVIGCVVGGLLTFISMRNANLTNIWDMIGLIFNRL